MSEQTDQSAAPDGQRQVTGTTSETKSNVSALPHFAMRSGVLRPPAKPFFKAASAEKSMSEKAALERPSGDRSFIERMGVMAPTTSYTPPPQRRTTEIPNLNSMRALDQKGDDKKLTISTHIKVSGEISGCERLVVEGEVNATLVGVSKLEIAAKGKVSGKAEVDGAVINGAFDGTLVVRGHLDIASGATVRGTISYKSVSVANGGRLGGTITPLDG